MLVAVVAVVVLVFGICGSPCSSSSSSGGGSSRSGCWL